MGIMKNSTTLMIFVLVIVIAAWIALRPTYHAPAQTSGQGTATTTAFSNSITMPGGVSFGYPQTYGLAVRPEQILVKAYIPPCDSGTPGFDYCLYRTATDYANTNFESAGLRVKARTDLTTKNSCLTTAPMGYTSLTPKMMVGPDYETSVFAPLGDAGAGHYSSGALYRLHYGNSCYEFQTRIGETQYANYPQGSIGQFTDANRSAVQSELMAILASVTIASSSEAVLFPSI